jgi:hypothetical protein
MTLMLVSNLSEKLLALFSTAEAMLPDSPMNTPESAPATTMAATKKMTCVVPESDIVISSI